MLTSDDLNIHSNRSKGLLYMLVLQFFFELLKILIGTTQHIRFLDFFNFSPTGCTLQKASNLNFSIKYKPR